VTLIEEWRKVRQLAQYDRLIARRSVSSHTLWVVARALPILLLVAVGLISVIAAKALATTSELQQASSLSFIFLAGGAAALYFLFIQLYNRLFILPYDVLLASPLSGRAIFIERTRSAIRTGLFFGLFSAPFLISLGVFRHAGFVYYPTALLLLALTMSSLVVSAALLQLILLLLLNKRMQRETLGLLSSLIIVALVVIPRLLSVNMLVSQVAGSLNSPVWSWIPTLWGAHAIMGALEGKVGVVATSGILLLLLTVLCGTVALKVANRVLHERVGRIQDGGQVRAKRTAGRTSVRNRHLGSQRSMRWRLFPRPVGAVVLKDWLRLKRTPSELLGVVVSIAYFWIILSHPVKGGQSASSLGLPTSVVLPYFMMLTALTTARLGISSLGTEREQIALLMQSPLTTRQLLMAKWLYAYVPSVVWTEMVLVIFSFISHLSGTLLGWYALQMLWIMAATCAICLPFAVHGASYVVRLAGKRNVYIKPGTAVYLLALVPFLAIQGLALLYGGAPLMPKGENYLQSVLSTSPSVHLALGLSVSFILSVIGLMIGYSTAHEGYRSRMQLILQSGSLG